MVRQRGIAQRRAHADAEEIFRIGGPHQGRRRREDVREVLVLVHPNRGRRDQLVFQEVTLDARINAKLLVRDDPAVGVAEDGPV